MDEFKITGDMISPLLDTRFVKVFDIQYEEGKHYYDATRHKKEDLTCLKNGDEVRKMTADAVSCFVIAVSSDGEARMLFNYEYRYPCGQYLLSVPAGLRDPEDGEGEKGLLLAAAREISEEMGIVLGPEDSLTLVNPAVFSTPGLTDESNALVCAVVRMDDMKRLSQKGAEGSERFDGFFLADPETARRLLFTGRDENGMFYSTYTWMALCWFVSGLWKDFPGSAGGSAGV